MVLHTAGIGLSAVVAKSYGCCCFLMERSHLFYDFVVGLQPADPLHADVAMPLSPAIGPHWVPVLLLRASGLPCKGLAVVLWAYGGIQRQTH